MIVLFKKHTLFPSILECLILFLALIQMIQITIISFIKLSFGIRKLWKNPDEFEVRNSPMDRVASLTVKLFYCWKVGCQVGSGGVSLLGTSVLIDTVLDASGQEKIFQPLMAKGIQGLIGGRKTQTIYEELQEKINKFNLAKRRFEEAKQLEQATVDALKDLGLNLAEAQEIQKGVADLVNLESDSIQKFGTDLKKKIDEISKK